MKYNKQKNRPYQGILVFNYELRTAKVRSAWASSPRCASDLTGWPVNVTNQDIELLYDFYNT